MLAPAALCLLTLWSPGQEPAASWLDHFQDGWSAYERGDLDRAHVSWNACLELIPSNATAAYYLACVAARRKRTDEAIEWLGKAASWGYADAGVLRWDEDLAALRADPGFASCLQQMDAALDRGSEAGTLSSSCRLESYFAGATGATSPDGTRFVLDACPALLLDIETGAILATLPAADGGTTQASAFSPDGRLIASCAWGKAVRLWDGWTGELVRELASPGVTTRGLRFSSDGRRLMTTGEFQDQAAVWSLDSGQLVFLATKPANDLACLSADGTRALTAGNGDLDFWDTERKRVIATERPAGEWTGGGFSADGALAFAWSPQERSVIVLDAGTGKWLERRAIGAPLGVCTPLGASHCLAIVEQDGSIALWDPLAHSTRTLPAPSAARVFSLASSPDGKLLAEYTDSGTLVISAESGATVWRADRGSPYEHRMLRFTTDSSMLLLIDWSFGSELREARSGRIRLRLPSYSSSPRFCGQGRDGRRGCVRCGPNSLRVFEMAGVQSAVDFDIAEGTCFAFAPDSAELALVDPRGEVVIRDCAGGHRLRGWSSGVPETREYHRWRQPNWSPDGRTLLIRSHDQPAVIFDARNGERLATLGNGTIQGGIAAWSRDGRRLAFSPSENTIAVFDARSGARLGPDLVHGKPITCADFDLQGERLLVGSRDAKAHVWDWKAGGEVLSLSHADQDIFGSLELGQAEYSPDGTRIVTTTDSLWEVALWNAQDGSRVWAYDYGGGNEAPIAAHFDAEGKRVYVSGPGHGRAISDVASGQSLIEADRFGLGRIGQCLPIANSPFYLVEGPGGISMLDSRGDTLRIQRIEQPGGSLIASASRHFSGDSAVAASARITFGARSESLADYAALLCDPKRVRAAAQGVVLQPVRLSALPQVVLPPGTERELSCSGDALELDLGCKSAAPALRYLVESNGSEKAYSPREGETTIRVRFEKPQRGDRSIVRLRVVDANGLQSRPVRLSLAFTSGR